MSVERDPAKRGGHASRPFNDAAMIYALRAGQVVACAVAWYRAESGGQLASAAVELRNAVACMVGDPVP